MTKVARMDDIRIEPFLPEHDEACRAIERDAPQGKSYRLRFRRERFSRRAETYDDHRICVARMGDRIVGVTASAQKSVVFRGRPTRAAFFFDARVASDVRGRGVGKRLADHIVARAWEDGAEFGYGFVVDDNHVSRGLASHYAEVVAAYHYLVWPVFRLRRVKCEAREATVSEIHDAFKRSSGPFDLYFDPRVGGRLSGHVASLLSDDAGCSIWSNARILAEEVVSIPWRFRVARKLLESWPLRLASWPHIPAPGEALKSWFVFDFFARTGDAARDLMRNVDNRARAAGIDYCYVVFTERDEWARALRADTPRAFSPIIPYVMVASRRPSAPPVGRLDRINVDIRDL